MFARPAPGIIVSWCAFALCANGFRMPGVLSSNMVMQRSPLAARLWGFGNPSEVISVTLDDGEASTTVVDSGGNWVLELEPQAASTGRRIKVAAPSGDDAVFENVAFGDVYLCAGQSNMELQVSAVENATEEIEDSRNYPDLRFFHVRGVASDAPHLDCDSKSDDFNWTVSGPDAFYSADESNLFAFPSATCYFFGRDLYKDLGGDVPIGFVAATWGNMPIQVFASPDVMADRSCGGTRDAATDTTREDASNDQVLGLHGKSHKIPYAVPFTAGAEGDTSKVIFEQPPVKANGHSTPSYIIDPNTPDASEVWNGMLYPLLNMRLSGAVWYQGEANTDDPDGYECLLPAMIADWRTQFELPDLEFYIVQVSTGELPHGGMLSPEIRLAQLSGLRLNGTVVIPSYDLGEPHLGLTLPLGALHPRRKQEVGRRLALAVEKLHHGLNIVASGPVFEEFHYDAQSGNLTISFTSATADGLHFNGIPDCTTCCDASPFDVQISDGTWHGSTENQVSGNEVTLALDAGLVDTVVAVRYAFTDLPECGLYNGDGGADEHTGLVALPFVETARTKGRGHSRAHRRLRRRRHNNDDDGNDDEEAALHSRASPVPSLQQRSRKVANIAAHSL